eukprot:TRINITY_DN16611_c0_g1_i1.p3 TRINITY_DN16611_c0_g1~~TRINITY_DN16611_c0_g1_i1.p3  ORF type:complete len:117 (+),score=8.03 TRINITY_DN16611_c0_g1_i1:51-401(+)
MGFGRRLWGWSSWGVAAMVALAAVCLLLAEGAAAAGGMEAQSGDALAHKEPDFARMVMGDDADDDGDGPRLTTFDKVFLCILIAVLCIGCLACFGGTVWYDKKKRSSSLAIYDEDI